MLPRVILHLDMNSYFASVEQQANPWLRGKPVGVVATMTPRGCVIASSVEAKAKGIKTGCRVQEARQLDPKVILIPNDSAKYRSCTEGIMRILHRYTEDIEHYSIDEAFLDLTGFVYSYDEAAAVAERIRTDIQAEIGSWLRCSVGIAPTRWLAKFGGDVAPKGGTLIVHPGNLTTTLDPLRVTEAWGIASRMEQRLNALDIYTLGELRRYPVVNLMQAFGLMGYQLWADVNGIELGGVQRNSIPKSVGHSHVFAKRATSLEYPRAILAKLCEKAGRRLRRLELEAGGVWLSYGLPSAAVARWGRSGGSTGQKLGTPIVDTRDIFQYCWRLLSADLPRGALPNF
jgi:DNA polymerase-4